MFKVYSNPIELSSVRRYIFGERFTYLYLDIDRHRQITSVSSGQTFVLDAPNSVHREFILKYRVYVDDVEIVDRALFDGILPEEYYANRDEDEKD